MEKKDKKYTLKVKGKEVEVNEEIYRAYIRPVQAEQRQKRRVWKCRVLSKSGNYYVRCTKKCETCPYYLAGNSALGNVTSLDRLVDCEVEIEDKNSDFEADYIEQQTIKEEYAELHKVIRQLTSRQQEIVKMIYFEGKTQKEVAKVLGITQGAVSLALAKSIAQLKFLIKK
ncbi:TPA: sigma-70 family RNA polymerase sigma factor [Candidatus Scatousia excrementigallinarum]|uniref:Sigma-70 family RNA polymerase sigma factor n=1 Tax=Candidatus Scatousia excrementigallinarum TaxID=2840935 RepID=A0A9D1JM34_9BACT|nr:sigma-70 family RNA polymerase sigma factor [Candidatus Scatousia excrementigallinarum]